VSQPPPNQRRFAKNRSLTFRANPKTHET